MVRKVGVTVLTLLMAVGAAAVTVAPASAAAATRYVATNGSDSENDCTGLQHPCQHVQYAVDQADVGDTVSILDKGPYHESVSVHKRLTIAGQGSTGAGRTVIDGFDGDPSIRVAGAESDVPAELTLEDVAVDGNTDNTGVVVNFASVHLRDVSASTNDGDGLDVQIGSTATVTDSVLSHNGNNGINASLAAQRGLAVASAQVTVSHSDVSDNDQEGIDVVTGTLAVDNSTIDRNADGGVLIDGSGSAAIRTTTFDANIGAGVVVDGPGNSVVLTTSTISNTEPFSGSGTLFGAGLIDFVGTAQVSDSTIVGNTGEGVLNMGGSVTVASSTVSGTHPAADAELPSGGVVTVSEEPAVRTMTRFTHGKTFSSVRKAAASVASVTLTGSIVAEQDGKVPDCAGTITDGGDNLSSDAANSCKFSAANHDQVKTDPLLGPLADNGGPTKTEVLRKGSPAIDAIPGGKASCSPAASDQRGVDRPQPTGGKCDVGAVELTADKLAIHPNSLPDGKVGQAYHATITASGGQYPVYAFSLAAGSLPDGLKLGSHGRLSGTPTQAGTFHFTVSVNDPVLKDYTVVITDAAPNGGGTQPISNTGAPTGGGTQPISNTGAPVFSLAAVGAGTILAGFLLMIAAGLIGRRPGRLRPHQSRV
jgi:hypothetical protein